MHIVCVCVCVHVINTVLVRMCVTITQCKVINCLHDCKTEQFACVWLVAWGLRIVVVVAKIQERHLVILSSQGQCRLTTGVKQRNEMRRLMWQCRGVVVRSTTEPVCVVCLMCIWMILILLQHSWSNQRDIIVHDDCVCVKNWNLLICALAVLNVC